MNKLEKAIEDRIALRAENFKLKQNTGILQATG
jgi:hypothetical protein